jgi:nitronate monooxygenase
MGLRTAFTDLAGVEHPVVSAPMGGCAGGALAAAVSGAGGLGLIGAAREEVSWWQREVALVKHQTDRPWGIGFQTWALARSELEAALASGPRAVMLSFGDPEPFAARVRETGALLMVQVTDMEEARKALSVNADVIIAQGTEAGGHGGRRSTLPFVPAVVDLVAPTPVLAAGGIADGRGLAAALVLGATGALVGTRFQVTQEALVSPEVKKAIVAGQGEDTLRSRVLDIARGAPWPARYPARTLRNPFLEEWLHKEDELSGAGDVLASYREALGRRDVSVEPIWASEAIDLVNDVPPAGDVVALLAKEAENVIKQAHHCARGARARPARRSGR